MIKDFSNLPDREEEEVLHERELDNARRDAAELFNRSFISHECDIDDEETCRFQAIAEMIAASMLLSSERYHLEMASRRSLNQPQKKGSVNKRELPDSPTESNLNLNDFRGFSV